MSNLAYRLSSPHFLDFLNFLSAESLYILKIHLCSKRHEFWMKKEGVITKTRFWKMSKKWTLRELCSKKGFFQNFLHSFPVSGHQDLSNGVCQTPCTFSGLKIHLERNVEGLERKSINLHYLFFSKYSICLVRFLFTAAWSSLFP